MSARIDPTKPRYPIATLSDMAAIPDDALPRFLAELPLILRTHRQLDQALPVLAAKAHAEMPRFLRWFFRPSTIEASLRHQMTRGRRLTWVDDDKGLATVSMRVSETAAPFFEQTERMQ